MIIWQKEETQSSEKRVLQGEGGIPLQDHPAETLRHRPTASPHSPFFSKKKLIKIIKNKNKKENNIWHLNSPPPWGKEPSGAVSEASCPCRRHAAC